ncbi:MAG TPA: carboxypeptidase-like regulatory domain-containing protein [Solirubrobacterales bacterium]|nr:carboxypeptidase-like regulatory domain-containing protein [Solirubrobacterales bacterium]
MRPVRRRRSSASVAVALLALATALAVGAAPAAAATGSIAGTVTDADAGVPAAGVEVCAWEVAGGEGLCELTQGDGTYLIGGLEPGDYTVEFWPGEANLELALQFFDGADRWEEADVVSLADGEARAGVDADLGLGSTIAGNVFDAGLGRSVEGVWVCSIDALNDELLICDRSNANGNYGLPFHPAGEYKVVFSPDRREWGTGFLAEDDGYPTRFWNEATSLADAFTMSLGTAWFAGGIDVRYGTPPVATPPPVSSPLPAQVRKPRKCRRGYRKKLVRGKRRCVRVHRKHRRHRHRHAGAAMRLLGR